MERILLATRAASTAFARGGRQRRPNHRRRRCTADGVYGVQILLKNGLNFNTSAEVILLPR
jgi:hypothetical protein